MARELSATGVDLADARALIRWRDAVIAQPRLLAHLPTEADRLAGYGGNLVWARSYWDRLEAIGWFDTTAAPRASGALGATASERSAADLLAVAIPDTAPPNDRTHWECLVIDNVERAFALCGQPVPAITDLDEARERAQALDGALLAIDATSCRSEPRRSPSARVPAAA